MCAIPPISDALDLSSRNYPLSPAPKMSPQMSPETSQSAADEHDESFHRRAESRECESIFESCQAEKDELRSSVRRGSPKKSTTSGIKDYESSLNKHQIISRETHPSGFKLLMSKSDVKISNSSFRYPSPEFGFSCATSAFSPRNIPYLPSAPTHPFAFHPLFHMFSRMQQSNPPSTAAYPTPGVHHTDVDSSGILADSVSPVSSAASSKQFMKCVTQSGQSSPSFLDHPHSSMSNQIPGFHFSLSSRRKRPRKDTYSESSDYMAEMKSPGVLDDPTSPTSGTTLTGKQESGSTGNSDTPGSGIDTGLTDWDYLERRRKNNEAAKRSRDARRMKEEGTALRAAYLEQENIRLKAELQIWRTESAKLHRLIYNRL